MRVLVIDRSPPCDEPQGNTLIAYQVLGRLAHRHEVSLVSFATGEQRVCFDKASIPFARTTLVKRHSRVNAMGGFIANGASVVLPRTMRGSSAARLIEATQRMVRTMAPDVVHVRQLPMAPIGAMLEHPAKLLELVDSETLQNRRALRLNSPRTWARWVAARLLEPLTLDRYQAITTVSEADAAAIRTLRRTPRVHVIQNGVDAERFHPSADAADENVIMFTGAMSYAPNVAAVTHFVNAILPLILDRRPGARFVIAGRDPAASVLALASPSVEVTGYVEDMPTTLARAAVIVCPMVSGSGIKNKLLEAMASGRPVVASPLGVEGLPLRESLEVEVARDPETYAARVTALLSDPRRATSVGMAGREAAMRLFSWDDCAARYEHLWETLATEQHHAG